MLLRLVKIFSKYIFSEKNYKVGTELQASLFIFIFNNMGICLAHKCEIKILLSLFVSMQNAVIPCSFFEHMRVGRQ